MPLTNAQGYGWDAEAFQLRISNVLTANAIGTRAQMLAVWAGLTQTQQIKVLADLILGSIVFPGESLTPAQIAVAGAP